MSYYLSNFNELSRTSNVILSRRISQDFIPSDILPTHPGAFWNAEEWFRINLTKAQIKITDKIIYLFNVHKVVDVSDDKLAALTGYSIRTVSKTRNKLKEMGLLTWNYRHLKTNVYKLSSYFSDIKVKKELCRLFKSLYYLPVYLRPQLLNVNNIAQFEQQKLQVEKYRQLDLDYKYLNTVQYSYSTYTSNCITATSSQNKTKPSHNSVSIKKGKKVMNNIENYIPRSDIARISCLNLTPWGQIKLSAFPAAAVAHAVKNFKKDAYNPFGWFFKDCNWWCDKNKIAVDFTDADKTAVQYGRPEGAEMYIERPVSVSVKEKTVQNAPYCCASCQLNKTHGPLKVTGNLRTCDKERTKTGPEYTERSGELRSEAKEKIFNSWKTADGILDFANLIKLIGWTQVRFHVNGFLLPEDWLPEEQPVNLVKFITEKINAPF